MGSTLSREFSLSPIDTGRTTPGQNINLPGAEGTGLPAMTVQAPPTPVMRQSFLTAFLANLGPALGGGLASAPGMPFGTGLPGALQGITEQNRYADQQRQQNLLLNNQLATAARQNTPMMLPNGTVLPYWQAEQISKLGETQSSIAKNAAETSKAQRPSQVTPPEGYALAIQDAQRRGVDPSTDPTVQQWANAIQGVQKAPAETGTADDQKFESLRAKQLQGQPLSSDESAFLQSYKERKTLGPVASAQLSQPNKDSARMDKSYELNSKQLTSVRKPVDDAIARMGRLQETLAQKTPQADALVAPELLTIMAGGAGSGLRMNEAEISRVVGGRSAWEDLKGALQHWSTNPDDARSITDTQDKQIRALVDAVHTKLVKKQGILDQAEQDLIDADDVQSHRQILSKARRDIDAVDAPQQQAGNGPPASAAGTAMGSDGKRHWVDAQGGDLGAIQ